MSAVEITKRSDKGEELNPILATGGIEQVEQIPATGGPGEEEEEEEEDLYYPPIKYSRFEYFGTKVPSKGHLGYVPMEVEETEKEAPLDLVEGFDNLDQVDWEVKIGHTGDKVKTKIILKMHFKNPHDDLVSIRVAKTGENSDKYILFPRSGCTCTSTQVGFTWTADIMLVEDTKGKSLLYKFSSGNVIGVPESKPTGAFKSAYKKRTGADAPPYINGRMLVGIFYPEVQLIIKDRFTHQ